MRDAVCEAVILIVMDKVMMHMMVLALLQKNRGMVPSCQFAIVHFKMII